MHVLLKLFPFIMIFSIVVAGLALAASDAVEYKPREYPYPAKYATINGIKIFYTDEGSGERAMIFVHGLAGNLSVWENTIPKFVSHNRIVALDLPGHGNSERRNDIPYGIPLFAETLKGLMDHLDIKEAVIVGISMGGHTAAYFSWKYPERTEAAVLVDAAGMEINFPGIMKYFIRKHPKRIAKAMTIISRRGAKKNKKTLMERFAQKDGKRGARSETIRRQ